MVEVGVPPPDDKRLAELEHDIRTLRRADTQNEKRRLEVQAEVAAVHLDLAAVIEDIMALEVRIKKLEDDPMRRWLTPKTALAVLVAVGLLNADLAAKLLTAFV